MSLDGRLLARAAETLTRQREAERDALLARRAEVYARLPAVKTLDAELSASVIEAVGEALKKGSDAGAAVMRIAAQNLEKQAERAELLVANGYPADYIDEKYRCEKCRDTGYVRAGVCDCLMALYRAEQTRELSSLLGAGGESFEDFDLMLYSMKPDPKSGIVPRLAMELTLETCRSYAAGFGGDSVNLLLIGAPGLGKTYLSACIARAVAAKGVSVVYETAVGAIASFENQKFSRDAKLSELASAGARRCLECELLVLDDLGTEMITAFSVSALYTLLNTRLISGRKTVASTNLSLEELRRKYPPSVMSRLEGEFELLPFYGSDIRLIKKERA